MKVSKLSLFLLFLLLLTGCANFQNIKRLSTNSKFVPDEINSPVGVTLTGVHHLGPHFMIRNFTVDGYFGGSVGEEGGGGSYVCCVMLPKKWRSSLVVEIEWNVLDFNENATMDEVQLDRERTVEKIYKAMVHVEKYEEPEGLYIHFYRKGGVRVVSSIWPPGNQNHPILDDVTSENIVNGILLSTKLVD
jgi:hypothetical protein